MGTLNPDQVAEAAVSSSELAEYYRELAKLAELATVSASWVSTATVKPESTVGEIEIRGSIGSRSSLSERAAPADQVLVPAARVIREILDFRRRGVPVLLVTIESRGGLGEEAFLVFYALRRFSLTRGTVVVHLQGTVASGGTIVALAGDYITMDPAAFLGIHSASGTFAAQMNRLILDLYASRTLTPRPVLERWLAIDQSPDGVHQVGAPRVGGRLLPDAAVSQGWADYVCSRNSAKVLAAQLAQGHRIQTPRYLALRSRPDLLVAPPAWTQDPAAPR